MKRNPDFILGLPSDSEQDLIKSTYKALIKIYHPDSFKGDKNFADKKIKDLNWSYEELNDSEKRKYYASKIQDKKSDAVKEFNSKENNTIFENALGNLWADWETAIAFRDEINKIFNNLKKIDIEPALLFIIIILDTKKFDDAKKLSEVLEDAFLKSRFGENEKINLLAKFCLQNNYTEFAHELNQAIRVLGDDQSERIIQKLFVKHKEIRVKFSLYTDTHNNINHVLTPVRIKKLKAALNANYSIEIIDLLLKAGYVVHYLDENYCSITNEFGEHISTVRGLKGMMEVVKLELNKIDFI